MHTRMFDERPNFDVCINVRVIDVSSNVIDYSFLCFLLRVEIFAFESLLRKLLNGEDVLGRWWW